MIDEWNYESVIKELDLEIYYSECDLEPLELLKSAYNNPEHKLKLSLLIPPIAKNLYEETLSQNPSFHAACESLMVHIAAIGLPDDMLMDFIEEAETSDSAKFKAMLKCFKVCLSTINTTTIHPLSWCLNTVVRHINNVDLPEDFRLEGKEKLLVDSDPNVVSLESLYEGIIDFTDSVLLNVFPRFKDCSELPALKDIIIQFLLKLLGKPLAYMDLESEESKGSLRSFAETIMSHIASLSRDLLMFLDFIDDNRKEVTSDDVVDFEYTNLSLSVFYYLLFHEGVYADSLPQVYSPFYLFEVSIKMSLVLFGISENLVQRKGLLLISSVLDRVSEGSLKHTYLDYSLHSKFIETVPAIMIYSEVKENRQLAVQVFKKYLFRLDSVGRYTVLLNIQRVVTQPGFIGYIATLIKDIIVVYLSTENKQDMQCFSGKRLRDLLWKLCTLDNGVETDLIESSDRVISSLNLLRYLLLRDKENVTGIKECTERLEKEYLSPLIKGVDVSRAHYRLQLRELDKAAPGSKLSLTIGGETLPNMSLEEKRQVLLTALNTLDLIDSLASRVNECIQTYIK